MIKRCSICGISLQFTDEINFCRFCRQQILKITSAKGFIEQGKKISVWSLTYACSICKTETTENDKYCRKCGQPF